MNLRSARKARSRVKAAQAAVENRLRHGRTLEERRAEQREQDRIDRTISGARLNGE